MTDRYQERMNKEADPGKQHQMQLMLGSPFSERFWEYLFERDLNIRMEDIDLLRCVALVTEETYALEQFYKKEFTLEDVKQKVKEYFEGQKPEVMQDFLKQLLEAFGEQVSLIYEKIEDLQKEKQELFYNSMEEMYLVKMQEAEKQKRDLLEEVQMLKLENASLHQTIRLQTNEPGGRLVKWYLQRRWKKQKKKWKAYALKLLGDPKFSGEQLEILIKAIEQGLSLSALKKLSDPDMKTENMKKTFECLSGMEKGEDRWHEHKHTNA